MNKKTNSNLINNFTDNYFLKQKKLSISMEILKLLMLFLFVDQVL